MCNHISKQQISGLQTNYIFEQNTEAFFFYFSIKDMFWYLIHIWTAELKVTADIKSKISLSKMTWMKWNTYFWKITNYISVCLQNA